VIVLTEEPSTLVYYFSQYVHQFWTTTETTNTMLSMRTVCYISCQVLIPQEEKKSFQLFPVPEQNHTAMFPFFK